MTREQERARAKRRYERQQSAALQRQQESRRNKQVVAVTVVVLAMIAGFVLIAQLMKDDKSPATASASGSATGSASQTSSGGTSASPTTTTMPKAYTDLCKPAPAVPGTQAQLSKPDTAAVDAVKGKTVTATLATNCGDIVLTLDGVKAPETVASFVQLAEQSYWQDAPCHRLTTAGIYVLQCGDPTGQGSGGPGYGFGIENAPKDGKYPRGTVAMARAQDPNSNGGQFFLVYKDTELPTEGGGYTIFGKVTKGLDILDTIAAGGVTGGGSDGAPAFPISTLSVTTATKG